MREKFEKKKNVSAAVDILTRMDSSRTRVESRFKVLVTTSIIWFFSHDKTHQETIYDYDISIRFVLGDEYSPDGSDLPLSP
jgi:hypothetical protein